MPTHRPHAFLSPIVGFAIAGLLQGCAIDAANKPHAQSPKGAVAAVAPAAPASTGKTSLAPSRRGSTSHRPTAQRPAAKPAPVTQVIGSTESQPVSTIAAAASKSITAITNGVTATVSGWRQELSDARAFLAMPKVRFTLLLAAAVFLFLWLYGQRFRVLDIAVVTYALAFVGATPTGLGWIAPAAILLGIAGLEIERRVPRLRFAGWIGLPLVWAGTSLALASTGVLHATGARAIALSGGGLLAIGLAGFGLLTLVRARPSLARWRIFRATLTKRLAESGRPVVGTSRVRVGDTGVTEGVLWFSGDARFGRRKVQVVSHDQSYVEAGVPVKVVSLDGNRALVQRQDGAPASTPPSTQAPAAA